jgi:cation diffusion facilitator family transporter
MDDPLQFKQYKKVQRVLWQVLGANLLITIVKIVLGTISGSLAVVADGFHSMVDSSSNLIGLAAIKLAARPADEQYPYGYQRYETLGAMAIGGLLVLAAWEIIQSMFERFIQRIYPEINWLTMGIMALTLPINLLIVLLETRAGKKFHSVILLADANHTKTDLFVTSSVIGSLVGVWMGWPWLDLIVAGGVVVLILRAAIDILRGAAGSLADIAGVNAEKVEKVAESVPGVSYVHRVRSRGTADALFVDLHVKVDPAMSTAQAHAVASEVERRVRDMEQNIVDAIVHVEPAYGGRSSDWERISYGLKQIAEGMGLGLHDLHVHVNQSGDIFIELDLEFQAEITLAEAHEQADEFEQRAMEYWPDTKQVITHLEPAARKLYYPSEMGDENLQKKVSEFLGPILEPMATISVNSTVVDDRYNMTLKFLMRGDISLEESHNIVEEIKRSLMQEFPEIARVVIHVEPWNRGHRQD